MRRTPHHFCYVPVKSSESTQKKTLDKPKMRSMLQHNSLPVIFASVKILKVQERLRNFLDDMITKSNMWFWTGSFHKRYYWENLQNSNGVWRLVVSNISMLISLFWWFILLIYRKITLFEEIPNNLGIIRHQVSS